MSAAHGRRLRAACGLALGLLSACAGSGAAPASTSEAPASESNAPASESDAPEAPARKASWARDEGAQVLSNSGRYHVSYLLKQLQQVPLNENFQLIVRVVDPQSRSFLMPVAEIVVDARMPAHGHGMKQNTSVRTLPDGSYEVDGMLLHMTGHWELYVDLTEGARTDRAQFDIYLE